MSDIDIDGLDDFTAVIEDLTRIKEQGESDAVYQVTSNAEYSSVLEFGRGPVEAKNAEALRFEIDGKVVYRTSVSGHPPYPFFRPALRDAENNLSRLVRQNLGVDVEQAETTTQALELIALALESQMKTNATAGASGRSVGTHPNHPQVKTGNLRAGIGSTRIK